jgi:hypothetical protein
MRTPSALLSTTRILGRPWVGTAIAVGLYTTLAITLTWPLVKDLDNTIFGAFGDLTGSIASVRELVQGHHFPFAPGTLPDFSAPDGRPIDWTQNTAAFPSTIVLYVLTAMFGAVAAFGLFVLFGLVASGTAMFLLVRKLTGHLGTSLLIGWAYAFYPFAVVKAAGHVHFVHGWAFVLVLWRMLVLFERPTVRNGVIAGLATVLALAWSQYFLLIGGIQFATLLCFGVARTVWRKELRNGAKGYVTAAAIVTLFALALVTIASFSERGTGIAGHSIDEVIAFSARPLEYVVPPAGNSIVGDKTGPWLQKRLHGSNFAESTLYVGISMLLLGSVGLLATVRRRVSPRVGVAAVAAAVMGLVALIWSAPPKVTILGHVFPFPSLLTFDLSSAWRVYTRFVMVVMLGVCVLAAIGLHRILRGRRPMVQYVLLALIAAVVVTDLRVPGVGTNRVVPSVLFERLGKLPPGIVANYPIEPNGHGDYSAEFNQQWHNKPIINGYVQGSLAEARALRLDRLANRRTPGRLATLGVRYVVIEDVPIEQGVQAPGKPGRDLHLLMRDGATSLWRVTARPLPLLTLGSGFSPNEISPEGRQFQWLTSDEGELEFRAPCARCNGKLSFDALSFYQTRELRLVAPDGSVVGRKLIGAHRYQRVVLPVHFARKATYRIETTPGPRPIASVRPTKDARSLSVAVSHDVLTVD